MSDDALRALALGLSIVGLLFAIVANLMAWGVL